MNLFEFHEVPQQKGARWFVRRGAKTKFDRGFKSKVEANAWIDSLGKRVDWRVGYLFQLRGDSQTIEIVDRLGKQPDKKVSVSPPKRIGEIA